MAATDGALIHRKKDASLLDEVIRLRNVVEFRFNV